MREKGITSARRSQQYCGNSSYGEADILADELPFFHIECKGTKAGKLQRNILKEWWKQIYKDVRPGKFPVVFHIANNRDPVALVPDKVVQALNLFPLLVRHVKRDSITPSEHTGKCEILAEGIIPQALPPYWAVAFHISEEEVFYVFNGSQFLEAMKQYEPGIRLLGTVDGRTNTRTYS